MANIDRNKYDVIAVIPARGGSKGIPKKNMVDLLGKPLIEFTIDAAINSKAVEEVFVSSDDEDILEFAEKKGVIGIKRPKHLSTDEAITEPTIIHVIDELRKKGITAKWGVLLQPTSPLRTSNDIDNALFKMLKDKNALGLVSVFKPEKEPFKAFTINKDGYLKGLVNNKAPFMRRQDCPKTYYSNGAIYIFDIEDFVTNNGFSLNNYMIYEMPFELSYDIDSNEDLDKVRRIMEDVRK